EGEREGGAHDEDEGGGGFHGAERESLKPR
ncbi:MAG: hypothetical protein RL376_154, partial [Verrucomicrobiota bacterium]